MQLVTVKFDGDVYWHWRSTHNLSATARHFGISRHEAKTRATRHRRAQTLPTSDVAPRATLESQVPTQKEKT